MKKTLCFLLCMIMILSSTLTVFAAYRRSANVSSENEQYAKALEEWVNSYSSWITGEDIYFIRYGKKFMERAVEVNKEKKTIKTASGKVINLNYDGFLRDFSGTTFFKKENNNKGSVWTTIKWPKIVIEKEKKEGSDSNGQYHYYEFKYSFNEDY